MKKYKKYDKDNLYVCPMCSDQALYVHNHTEATCTTCDVRGSVVKEKVGDHKEKRLHVTINGVRHSIEPEEKEKELHMNDLTDDEKICVVENNELICVAKKHIEK